MRRPTINPTSLCSLPPSWSGTTHSGGPRKYFLRKRYIKNTLSFKILQNLVVTPGFAPDNAQAQIWNSSTITHPSDSKSSKILPSKIIKLESYISKGSNVILGLIVDTMYGPALLMKFLPGFLCTDVLWWCIKVCPLVIVNSKSLVIVNSMFTVYKYMLT